MEELREKIAMCIRAVRNDRNPQIECLFESATDNILALIKEAGWINLKDFEEMASEYCRDQGWREPA